MALRKREETGSCKMKQQTGVSGERSLEWIRRKADYMLIVGEQYGHVANSTSRVHSKV